MIKLLFGISFFITGGHVIDTKFKLHKYDKENYKEIFHLKNKESVTTYCIKHFELEDLKKIKYHHTDGQKTKYKVTKTKNRDKVE